MARSKNSNRFPVLTLVMQLYKIVALVLGLIIALAAAFSFLDGGFGAGIATAIGGFILWVSVYASGEIIEVVLSIEESSRTLVNIQKRMLQLQQGQAGQRSSSNR